MTNSGRYGGIHSSPVEVGYTAGHHSIEETIHDEIINIGLPSIRPLLETSFLEWLQETGGTPFFRNLSIWLFTQKGELLLKHGEFGADRLSPISRAAEEALMLGKAVRYEWSECAAYITVVRDFRNELPIAAIAFIAEKSDQLNDQSAELAAILWRGCLYRALDRQYIKQLIENRELQAKETQRSDSLFQAAKRLYDQIDVSAVLTEMLASLGILYPGADVLLYLSQDYHHEDLRVRPLMFKHTSHDLVAKAFLEGKYAIEPQLDGSVEMAVPMSGKQAIYGVLCASFKTIDWDDTVLPGFMLLADSAGTAFENAKLYEQSNKLIDELRLINELTKQLNQSLRLNQIFQFVVAELLKIFKADYCCVLQLDKTTKQFVVMSTNIPQTSNDQFLADYGFCGIILRTKEPLIISDYWETRVVDSLLMDTTGSRSLVASPILAENEVVGVALIMNHMPNYFSYDNYKLLHVICSHIALAVTNASLHAEVRRMVITDNLTGLHARHYLNEQIQRRQKKDRLGSLILVDIDYFKQVNDTFGHLVGDRILVQVSEIIKNSIRQDDIAARWGGEELAVYLPGIQWDQAYRIAERILTKVKEETDPKVTVSCGVSEWTADSDKISVESLFYRADMALYEAKHNGKNCIFVR